MQKLECDNRKLGKQKTAKYCNRKLDATDCELPKIYLLRKLKQMRFQLEIYGSVMGAGMRGIGRILT